MNVEAELKAWPKKTISKTELERMFHPSSDAELCSLTTDAVAKGLLTPVKASGTNGNRMHPVYLKYHVAVTEDRSETIAEIDLLHPAIIRNGYLKSRPNEYRKYRDAIRKLNAYLFQGRPSAAVSKKERSFEIFDEEKQLEDRSFCNLLNHLGITEDTLRYYETPEYCFNDFIPERKNRMTLLICENKDIWFNIRRRMYENKAKEIFGTQIDGVVYGCGNRVSEVSALAGYTSFMETEHVSYLYWGDIDRAGLNIYLSLRKNNPDMDISLFAAAYTEMLHLAENRSIPDSADHRELEGNYEGIYGLFPAEEKRKLESLIRQNKRVPQEIVSYERLLTLMG